MKLTEADKKGILLAVMCMFLLVVSVLVGKAFEKSESAESPTVYAPGGIRESIVQRVFRGGDGRIFHAKILLENGKVFVNKVDGYAFRGTPEERAFFFAEKGDTICYSDRIVKIAFKQD